MAGRADERRGGLSGAGDALTFLAFTVAGVGYILWSKASGLPAAAVTAVPVAIMLVYAAALVFVRALRLADDQGGDNLYYMGFLFTLSSLAVSLWQFSADGAAEEIVRNFGIAIASTVAGIALRIVLNQMRRDPAGMERAGRIELADAARRVRRELDATVVELNQFRRATLQVAEESWSGVHEAMRTIARDVSVEIEAATRAAEAPGDEGARRSGAALAAVEAETARATTSLAALAAALDQVVERLGALGAPERIEERMAERIAGADAVPPAAPGEATGRLGDDLSRHAAAMDRLAAALERDETERRADRAALERLADRLAVVATALVGASEGEAGGGPAVPRRPSAPPAVPRLEEESR